MQVIITKRVDGTGLLRCVRDDGSSTWQKQSPRHAAHFTHHDLTHFAVETSLGLTEAFFCLVAKGWDIDDTTGKGPRGPLPAEAGQAEQIVGFLDQERYSGVIMTAQEMNAFAATFSETRGVPPPPPVHDAQLAAIRHRRAELFQQWDQVAEGQELRLAFEVAS